MNNERKTIYVVVLKAVKLGIKIRFNTMFSLVQSPVYCA